MIKFDVVESKLYLFRTFRFARKENVLPHPLIESGKGVINVQ